MKQLNFIIQSRIIQRRLSSNERGNKEDLAKTFAKLVFQGKINAAMKLLTDIDAGVHKVDDTTLNKLQQKHPQPAPLASDALLNGPVNRVLPSYFDEIDDTMVFKSASMTKGAGGPSQLDAEQYRRLLTSNKYKSEKIANKSGCRYEKVLSIIKCKLSFLILRASLMCVRGSRSFTTHSGNQAIDDFEIEFDYTLG